MRAKTKNNLIYIIGALFLLYGGVRLAVSILLLLQMQGVLSFPDLQDGLDGVAEFMAIVSEKAIVPFSTGGYLTYLCLMGTFLVTGAVGCLLKKSFALNSLCVFLVLYVLLFMNFQTINPKVLHLAACAMLTAAYWRLSK